MTAWFYGVVSSVGQADTLADQEAWARTTAAAHGWSITRTFSDPSSGRSGVRELLEELLAALRVIAVKERPKRILLTRIDRLGRGLAIEAIGALAEIRKLGVILHTRESGDVRLDRVADAVDPMMRALAGAFENEGKRDRMLAGYEAKRRAGVPTGNRPPFGLRKGSDRRWERDPETAWIVEEADRRYLAGEDVATVLSWLRDVHAGAWGTRTGFHAALRQEAYVTAGIRTLETARRLDAMLRSRATRHGMKRVHDHAFSGVFRCGKCGGLMGEQMTRGPQERFGTPVLVCQSAQRRGRKHPLFTVRVARIEPAWLAAVASLSADDGALERWAQSHADVTSQRRRLEKSLARIDQDEARLAARADTALDQANDADDGVRAESRLALARLHADRAALNVRRETVQSQLSALAIPHRDPDELRRALAVYGRTYAKAATRTKNALNRALVSALGSAPVIDREGRRKWADVVVTWPDVLRRPVRIPYDGTGERAPRRAVGSRTGSEPTSSASAKSCRTERISSSVPS